MSGNGSARDGDTASCAQTVSSDAAAVGGRYAKAATKTGVVDNAAAGAVQGLSARALSGDAVLYIRRVILSRRESVLRTGRRLRLACSMLFRGSGP
jgi:hypothetical protein